MSPDGTTATNHFKIGLFVVATTLVTVGIVVVLGAGALFSKEVFVETYIDESVQGLEVGSPVKYRGVQVGRVEAIETANDVYGEGEEKGKDAHRLAHGRYVVVTICTTSPSFVNQTEEERDRSLTASIDGGLRVRLANLGITGTAYLEIDYLDSERFPPIDYDWEPRHTYVPSAPSSISRFAGLAEKVLDRLGATEIEQTVDHFDELLVQVTGDLRAMDLPALGGRVGELVAELQGTNERLSALLADPAFDGLPQDVSSILGGVRRTVEGVEGRVPIVLENLERATQDLDAIVAGVSELLLTEEPQRMLDELSAVVHDLRTTTSDLPDALGQAQRTLRRLDRTLIAPERHADDLLDDLRQVAANLRQITEAAKSYPSHMLFGEPPPTTPPTQTGEP